MKQYLNRESQWHIIEESFHSEYNRISESVMSQGNGHMGLRANFEESYSGDSLSGSYIAGVYYPDKTRVGWWKNGYPEYFAKVLNSTNWIGLNLKIDGEEIDLHKCEILDFRRDLHMKDGILTREVKARCPSGLDFTIYSERFVSMKRIELGVLRYEVTLLNRGGELEIEPYIDGNVYNEDSNYDEYFWNHLDEHIEGEVHQITLKTKKTDYCCSTAMTAELKIGDKQITPRDRTLRAAYSSCVFKEHLEPGEKAVLFKRAATVTSRDYEEKNLRSAALKVLHRVSTLDFFALKEEQIQAWDRKWQQSDIIIEGETAAQQGIRFNIFHLHQTYSGHDERLNIGPKGFTGEKYGGSTYWDTEAYCLPFYLSTADQKIARNLVIYRRKHLEKAIENAEKLGFSRGAALYPMVTMTGEECHNEWEITFEEIHRNGAIAYGIWNYINYTGDQAYLAEAGLEVLIGIARFWAQRSNWSASKKAYVILGVTGPNEYENNVNNNWYTNRIAAWSMDYARESLLWVQKNRPEDYKRIITETSFSNQEAGEFRERSEKMYYPEDTKRGVYLQQDGFLDKELLTVTDLKEKERPISQHWSWDRILRSCFIKQADVLQGLFFLEDQYDLETIERNFDFYEPMTVHESSLSPCVYSILANKIGNYKKAYELYLRTARLDLDDYNNDTEDGCHITSMAGTWMSVVYGFGGFRVKKGQISLNPHLPSQWKRLSFPILFRDRNLTVELTPGAVNLKITLGEELDIEVQGRNYRVGSEDLRIPLYPQVKSVD